MNYQTNTGLEIHVELKTKSKMFCGCDNDAEGKAPNTIACPICMGFPGTLPVINKKAVEMTIKTALALNCQIEKFTQWHRKNYFYPDLPKGYQISQYDLPVARNGELKLKTKNEKLKTINIRRVHLEEDAAKLVHSDLRFAISDQESPKSLVTNRYSLIDFNRAGVPLMEIVTEPNITSPIEAQGFCQKLQMILRNLNVSDADMEKGQMRCEANISLRELKTQNLKLKALGTKVEVKNLNSFKAVKKALEYEIERQKELLEKGEKIVQETRGWDAEKNKTYSQRGKETAPDYRYFPEPDLPPLNLATSDWRLAIRKIKRALPKTLEEKEKELLEKIGLSKKEINVLLKRTDLLTKLEAVKKEYFKNAALLLVHFDIARKIETEDLNSICRLITEGKIKRPQIRPILEEAIKTKKSPEEIFKEKRLKKISAVEIKKIIDKILRENRKAVKDYKEKKKEALHFLIGKVMRETKGQIEPEKIKKILIKKIGR